MLRWEEENKGVWFGYDKKDEHRYTVAKDENGWYFEFLRDMDGFDGYDTCEEAKADAEADWKYHEDIKDTEEEKGFSYEEAMEILGDLLYEERKEEGLF